MNVFASLPQIRPAGPFSQFAKRSGWERARAHRGAGDPLVQDHEDAEIRQVRLRIKKHESKEENRY